MTVVVAKKMSSSLRRTTPRDSHCHFTRSGFGWATFGSVELSLRHGLVRTDAPGGDVGGEIIFGFNRITCHPAQHCNLPYMSQSVRDWALKELLRRGLQRLRRSEIIIELFQCGKKTFGVFFPSLHVRSLPTL